MSSRSHDRRTERATAEEVAEVEHQLWEFAKRIDPPSVPEAKLRPGAFLWRLHRTWHSLGRGTGGLASRSFRALRDELLNRDPPVRNLQPKLYGNTALSYAEAEQLIDVMLESWHLEKGRNGKWQAGPLFYPRESKSAGAQDLEAIRENLLHTVFGSDDHLLLEEPIGVPPEFFLEERGRQSLCLIIATSPETIVHLSPSNAQAGFSQLVGRFFEAADGRETTPLLIWIYRLPHIRDNAEFHQVYHALSIHSAAITNWYLRLSRAKAKERESAQHLWDLVVRHCAFAIHGFPDWSDRDGEPTSAVQDAIEFDDDLREIDPEFFLPSNLPVKLANHPHVRRYPEHEHKYGLFVDITSQTGDEIGYWLFPERTRREVDETAETTGLPVFETGSSPGSDYDLAYRAVYQAACSKFGFDHSDEYDAKLKTLEAMGWKIFSIEEVQDTLRAKKLLKTPLY